MRKPYLKYIYLILISCCLLYGYSRLQINSNEQELRYIRTNEKQANSPFVENTNSITVVTEYTTCSICLAEIDEFVKISQEFDLDLAFNILLLGADADEMASFNRSMRKGVKIKSINVDNIDMNWFNYADTTYYAQILFKKKQNILLRAKLEYSTLTSKKSKYKLLTIFKEMI